MIGRICYDLVGIGRNRNEEQEKRNRKEGALEFLLGEALEDTRGSLATLVKAELSDQEVQSSSRDGSSVFC